MSIGSKLSKLLAERHVKAGTLARKTGISKSTIYSIIRRDNDKADLATLETIANYLDVPLSSFLDSPRPAQSAADAHPDLLEIKVRRRVPILGTVACGEPIFKPGDGTEFIDVEEDTPCTFALIAQGDSMIGDRIHDGDVVFIRAQHDVYDGEIAAVSVDDEVTLKHVSREYDTRGQVRLTLLLSSNPKYPPIVIGGRDETRTVRIMGKAVAVKFFVP